MNKKTAIQNLIIISGILKRNGVKYWLTDGTLLGLIRNGDFISHDKDTDIGVDFKTFTPKCFMELKKRFKIIHILGYTEDSLEISLMRGGVKTDLFFFYLKNSTDKNRPIYYHSAFYNIKKNIYNRVDYIYEYFETKYSDFLGRDFPIPEDPYKFITTKYGDKWETPVKKWNYITSPKNYNNTGLKIYKSLSSKKFQNWLKKQDKPSEFKDKIPISQIREENKKEREEIRIRKKECSPEKSNEFNDVDLSEKSINRSKIIKKRKGNKKSNVRKGRNKRSANSLEPLSSVVKEFDSVFFIDLENKVNNKKEGNFFSILIIKMKEYTMNKLNSYIVKDIKNFDYKTDEN